MQFTPVEKMSQVELKVIFEEAANLIFHPEMLAEFLVFTMSPVPGKGIASAKHPEQWATGMAELYAKSKSYREFISRVWGYSIPGLSSDSGVLALARYKSRKTSIDDSANSVLIASGKFLLENPEHPKWLGLIHFCLSRALATTAAKGFAENAWSEDSMFSMQLDQAYSRGESENFGKLITQVMPKYWESKDTFPKMLGARVGVGLANMVALDPHAHYFHEIAATTKN